MVKIEQFNKLILKMKKMKTCSQRMFFLIWSFPDMYDALYDCYSIFWTPRSYKDMQIVEHIKQTREEYFDRIHVRSSYASLGDLILHLAREA